MNRTEFICECKFGHPAHVTPYVDSNGAIRLIIDDLDSGCIVCAGIADSNDKDEFLKLVE